jgi:hypothetical protein
MRYADWLYTPQMKMGASGIRSIQSSRSLNGLPLAWGEKAQAAEDQGVFACVDWYSGFLLSCEVPMTPEVVTGAERTSSGGSGAFLRVIRGLGRLNHDLKRLIGVG